MLHDELEAAIRVDLQCWVRDAVALYLREGLSREAARPAIYHALLSSMAAIAAEDRPDATELRHRIVANNAAWPAVPEKSADLPHGWPTAADIPTAYRVVPTVTTNSTADLPLAECHLLSEGDALIEAQKCRP